MRNNKNKGFTLVELLVVIAILAILATVSVVGYTSFIKSAHISNDENIAAQLNQFLAAYQADHTTEHYGKPITEDNIWEITQTILKDSQLDELEPHAKDYGYHYYFKFDEQGGGEYVAADEGTLHISILSRILIFFAHADTVTTSNYAGIFFDDADNKYFLCDTKGSPIAETIKGFHTFKDITGESTAEQFANFKTLVNGLNDELYGDLKKLAESGVFVTKEGNFAFNRNEEHSNLFFHEDATYVGNVIKDTAGEKPLGETDYLLTINEDTTLTIPAGVKLPANSLNISVADGKNVTVKLDASAWTNELKDIVDAYFTNDNVTVVVGDKEYKINGNYIYDATKYNPAAPADHVDTLKFNNPLYSFEIGIVDKDDNLLLNGSKVVDETTIKAGFVAWEKGSFKLQLANTAGKNNSAISSLDVEWKVISGPATIAQDGTVTFTGNYSLGHDKIVVSATSTIDRNGYTSASAKFDEDNVAYNEYVIYIAGPQGYTVEIDNRGAYAPVDATLTNRTYNIGLAKEAAAGNTYNFKLTVANNENVIDGVAVNYSNIAVTFTCSEHGTSCENVIVTSNSINVKGACSGVITVKVGNYFTYTVNLTTVDVSNLPVQVKNNGIVLGNLNSISMSVLFKPATGNTFPAGAELKAFQKVNTGDSYAIPNRTDMYTSNTNGVTCWITNNDDASIKFNGTRTDDVHVAVFLNGQRISPDVQITDIVEAYNINDYTDIATAETNSASMVLLNNITVATNTSADEVITVKGGKTLYGNYYTINLPAPVAGSFSRDYSYIRLEGATMLNTKVVGTIYDSLSLSAWANDGKGKNAVLALSGSTIENCYIANTRSPLVSGSSNSDTAANKVIVKNSVLFGGRYCNVDLRGGTLEFQGEVITVNQPYEGVVGTGINVWLKAPTDTNVVIAEGATWTPYNFIEREETSALPEMVEVSTTKADMDIEVGLPLQKMFSAIFGECVREEANGLNYHRHGKYSGCCNNILHNVTGSVDGHSIDWIIERVHIFGHSIDTQYRAYVFAPTGSTKEYVNAAIVSLNDTTVLPTTSGTSPFVSTTYSINLYVTQFNLGIGTLAPSVTANQTLLTQSATAVSTYNPNAYGFVGGDLASLPSN